MSRRTLLSLLHFPLHYSITFRDWFFDSLKVLCGLPELFFFLNDCCPFKNQFLACQISLVMGFLPALLLSGLMFPISSMPAFFRYLTAVLPQRYFVSFIESEFLAGTISDIVLINTVYLSCLCLVLLFLVYKNTLVRLEK